MGKNYTYRIPATADDAFREYIEKKVAEEGSFPKFVTRLIEADINGETPVAAPAPAAAPDAAPAAQEAAAPAAPNISAPVIHTVNASDVVRKLQSELSSLNANNNDYVAALVNRIDVMLDYFEEMTRNQAAQPAPAAAPEPSLAEASAPDPESDPVPEQAPAPAMAPEPVPAAEPEPIPVPVAAHTAAQSAEQGAPVSELAPGDQDDSFAGLSDDDEFLNGAMLLLSD